MVNMVAEGIDTIIMENIQADMGTMHMDMDIIRTVLQKSIAVTVQVW